MKLPIKLAFLVFITGTAALSDCGNHTLTSSEAELSARKRIQEYAIANRIDYGSFVLSSVSSTSECPWVFNFSSINDSVKHDVIIYLESDERYELHRMIEVCGTQTGSMK